MGVTNIVTALKLAQHIVNQFNIIHTLFDMTMRKRRFHWYIERIKMTRPSQEIVVIRKTEWHQNWGTFKGANKTSKLYC